MVVDPILILKTYVAKGSRLRLCIVTDTAWKITECGVFSGPHFPRFWIEYGDLHNKLLYSVRMRENTDQKKLYT